MAILGQRVVLIKAARSLWLPAILLLLPAAGMVAAGSQEAGMSLIMAPGSAPLRFDREDVAAIFKQKKRFWEDGQAIRAVNLSASHPLRRAFSLQIFGRSPEELEGYWRDMYFHGIVPPYALASEEAVIRFVASTPGAIAYISHCLADQRVVVVMRLDNATPCPR